MDLIGLLNVSGSVDSVTSVTLLIVCICLVQRVHWLRAKAQLERWIEEECTIKNEAHWVPAYFRNRADFWMERMDRTVQLTSPGHYAYAAKQRHMWIQLAQSADEALKFIRESELLVNKSTFTYMSVPAIYVP